MKKILFTTLCFCIINISNLFSQTKLISPSERKGSNSLTLGGGIFAIIKNSDKDYRILTYSRFRINHWLNNNWSPFVEYDFARRTFSLTPEGNRNYNAIGIGNQYFFGNKKRQYFIEGEYHIGKINYFSENGAKNQFYSSSSIGFGASWKVYKNLYFGLDYKRFIHFYKATNFTAGHFNLTYYIANRK